jgi:hypothetical protein
MERFEAVKMARDIIKMMPQKLLFEGGVLDNPGDFIKSVEAEVGRWGVMEDEVLLAVAKGCLGRSALMHVNEWPAIYQERWDRFREKLATDYARPGAWLFDRVDLLRVRQGTSTGQAYIQTFQQAVSKCGQVGDELAGVVFFAGLSSDLRAICSGRVAERHDKVTWTLADLTQLALQAGMQSQVSQSRQGGTSTSKRHPHVSVHELENVPESESECSEEDLAALGFDKGGRKKRLTDYPPCERCGKKGHRADLCLAAMLQRIEELEGKDVGGQ